MASEQIQIAHLGLWSGIHVAKWKIGINKYLTRGKLMIARILLAATLITLSHSQVVKAETQPELVKVRIDKVFIPNGFDSNDRSQVVIDSYLPNPCYKVGPRKFRNDGNTIILEQWAYLYRGMICPQVIVPFSAVVDLGILKPAAYEVKDDQDGRKMGSLLVKKSVGAGPDDYFYAPITDARVDNRKWEVVIEGNFTNSCLEFSDMKVFADPKDVIIVQPILKPWREGDRPCKAGSFPFTKTMRLPPLDSGRYLLHARSMNGQAVNKVFDAEDRTP
jgi:hypothetical protein